MLGGLPPKAGTTLCSLEISLFLQIRLMQYVIEKVGLEARFK